MCYLLFPFRLIDEYCELNKIFGFVQKGSVKSLVCSLNALNLEKLNHLGWSTRGGERPGDCGLESGLPVVGITLGLNVHLKIKN